MRKDGLISVIRDHVIYVLPVSMNVHYAYAV